MKPHKKKKNVTVFTLESLEEIAKIMEMTPEQVKHLPEDKDGDDVS